MKIRLIEKNSVKIAFIESEKTVISNGQDALDLIAIVRHEHGCDSLIIKKELVGEDFFDLKTGIAGEVLQKYVNYQMKIAIIGDFSQYTSKALKDFIYESNKGRNVFFLPNEQEAALKLTAAGNA